MAMCNSAVMAMELTVMAMAVIDVLMVAFDIVRKGFRA